MKRFSILGVFLALLPVVGQQASVQPGADEKRQMLAKIEEIEAAVKAIRTGGVDPTLLADVDVFAKAGRWLLDFPGGFANQQDIDNALKTLDRGVERARQLRNKQAPWVARGRQVYGFYSALDGSVQPYGLTIPDSYDGTRPTRLYVWLHGRNARLTEASFLYNFPNPSPNTTAADAGQIQLDVYGRGNNANHWAGEVDVFEAIAAVQKRYNIDASRIVLRGFSLGGAAAWHLALHYPDRWAAAEIGAGTYPRRAYMPGFPPYQAATLRIWENINDWALNAFNLPLAAHDGDSDPNVASIPRPEPGTPTKGQLESSIKVREQLAKEGFPPEGPPDRLRARGTNAFFLISLNTAHSTSPLVRQHLDAFLKEWGDRGQVSPDRVRFLTYTTRYNKSYWVSVDGLEKHYERAEVNARRTDTRAQYQITTKNVTRLTLREMNRATEITIDGQSLKVKSAPEIAIEKSGSSWKLAGRAAGLRKTHGLQGPIDDAFLEPYLLVRPTGTPWNEETNRQALQRLERFDQAYARNYRAHPRIKDDKEVTEADFANYNVALFGDPGSNRWIAKIQGKLPMRWTKEAITLGERAFTAADHLPVMIYPSPLHPSRYVVLNSGLTIDEREYNSDYSMPRLGDFAVLRNKPEAEVAYAGLFDESWKLPKESGGR